MVIKSRIISLIVLLALCAPAIVIAGNFKVAPLKFSFDSRTKSAVLKVTNNDSEKVTVQLDAKHWRQDDKGEDKYTKTMDIVAFPKIVTIAGGEERIIRLGYQGKEPGSIEKTYRLYLQELPVTNPGEKALKFALTMSIPVFIKPLKKRSQWSLERFEYKEGNAFITVSNNGNSHIIVSKIGITMLDDAGAEILSRDIGGWYVLPGSAKSYRIPVAEKDCAKSSVIKARVEVADMKQKTELKLIPTDCNFSSKTAR